MENDVPGAAPSSPHEPGETHGRRSPGEELNRSLRPVATKLQRDLSRLLFDLLEKKRASGLVPGVPDRFPLSLSLELFAGGSVEARPDQLFDQIGRAVERWVSRTAAFPYGHVYCHWCQSFTCKHSVAPEPRTVFAGYSSTGQPTWRELAALLLDRRDPRIENIYREAATPVTLLQSGSELNRKQLSVYGKHSPIYRILGQVVLGYVALGGAQKRESSAVTFQAAELAGGERTALNIVGRLADGTPALEALEESGDPRMANALAATRTSLAEIALRRFPRRRRQQEKRRHAMGALRRLARHLDRIFRQRERRTRHSRKRHLDPRRPASSAFSDALKAPREKIYRDVEENTWVVIGPKNRVHVFNDKALHVTSVVYGGDTIRGRTTRGKWLEPRPEQLRNFQESLRRRARGSADEDAGEDA